MSREGSAELESVEGKDKRLRLAERIRLDEAVLNQNVQADLRRRGDGLRRRYLDLLAAALLDEHYLENEVRLEFLLAQPPGRPLDSGPLRDPVRTLPLRLDRLAKGRAAGRSTDVADNLAYFPYTDVGHAVLTHLEHVVDTGPDTGDLVEVGVGRGGAGIYLKGCLTSATNADRDLWVVDPFVATDAADANPDTSALARFRSDLNQVRDGYQRFGLLDDRVRFLVGPYDEVLDDVPIGPTAVLRIGDAASGDLGSVLEVLLPRVVPGGAVIVSGIGQPRIERALAELRDRMDSLEPLQRVDWNTASWAVATPLAPERTRPRRLRRRPPQRVAPVPARVALTDPVDLTVVVIFYDMRREASRTLRSLSRSYQVGLEATSYEVLVVDNGSSPDHRLSAEEVASYGPEFRLIEMGDDASPSPTVALNRGIAASRGRAVAMMIDGAHVLTPGVLGLGLKAMATYEPAIVAVQQWYVGPGQQGDAQQEGYDQAAEDRLFANIRWPVDGYRLFEIGHFIGDRDWFDGIVESNCLFAPRKLLEQVGAFDDSFSMPGGGYANLELFERLGAHPGINAASILGEGSFHQFHGGTTTNVLDDGVRRERVFSYGEHFTELRGRDLLGLNTPVHFVGAMATKAARRTRSRREITLAFDPARDTVTTTSTEPTHVPDELKLAAIEAIWDRQAWRDATWLGYPVNRYPTDLHSYQELLVAAAPMVVVMVADDPGLVGRALFVAGVCDQLSRGRVIAVGATEGIPEHPRLTGVPGDAVAADAVAEVERLVGGDPALVFVGLGAVERVLSAFEAYAPLVPVDGYLVVEHTVVNGRPAASGFGPGPHEAVVSILGRHREFVADVAYERYTITFNKGGFLRRTAPS